MNTIKIVSLALFSLAVTISIGILIGKQYPVMTFLLSAINGMVTGVYLRKLRR